MRSKLVLLLDYLSTYDKVTVAFSGGVDSTLLLAAALRSLGRENVLGVISTSALHPRRETEEAEQLAAALGARLQRIDPGELRNEAFLANPPRRCYICKSLLLTGIRQAARAWNCTTIVEGSNTDDLKDYRPGLEAVRELDIKSPFLELGFGKAEIRKLSRQLELPTWNKPAFACLASRIPCRSPISRHRLNRIEQAEDAIHKLGFRQFRVRDFETTCRIEIDPDDLPRIVEKGVREELIPIFKKIGYKIITLDLEGYRTGTQNPPMIPDQERDATKRSGSFCE
ncbi:MAG: ATP-dependent sacrificial sulfur transferase LarE [Deltaproteobacteria bacterium]|nr:ATP-dependent sacrificial sulfur transferase LarE [Deltaproteobacteria bacterium]